MSVAFSVFGIDACNKTIPTLIQRAWETAMELY